MKKTVKPVADLGTLAKAYEDAVNQYKLTPRENTKSFGAQRAVVEAARKNFKDALISRIKIAHGECSAEIYPYYCRYVKSVGEAAIVETPRGLFQPPRTKTFSEKGFEQYFKQYFSGLDMRVAFLKSLRAREKEVVPADLPTDGASGEEGSQTADRAADDTMSLEAGDSRVSEAERARAEADRLRTEAEQARTEADAARTAAEQALAQEAVRVQALEAAATIAAAERARAAETDATRIRDLEENLRRSQATEAAAAEAQRAREHTARETQRVSTARKVAAVVIFTGLFFAAAAAVLITLPFVGILIPFIPTLVPLIVGSVIGAGALAAIVAGFAKLFSIPKAKPYEAAAEAVADPDADVPVHHAGGELEGGALPRPAVDLRVVAGATGAGLIEPDAAVRAASTRRTGDY